MNRLGGADLGYIKVGVAVLLGSLATFCKQYCLIIALVAVIVFLDWLTGIIKAKIAGTGWNSERGHDGFWKKMASFVALAFGIFMDFFIPVALKTGANVELPFQSPFGMMIGVYIIFNECISICENLYHINPKIMPKFIIKLLEEAQSKLESQTTPSDSDQS
jgi:toxin secretion/phage lysis holin